jgi:diguanylate cyclase (GGDEF)-like protein
MTVAEHIALALANLKLQDTLRSQSIRDPLTGLFNRRYMEESLEREMRRAGRGRHPVGIIMLDLDHFKRFNDTFGHEAGDTLLREVGAVLQRSIRGEDIACRYGGEEFTLIMPEASLLDAAQRAEQLREAIRSMNIHHRRQQLGPVTISLGVAIYPDHGPTGDAVLRAADAALYQAKARGRDRVAINPGGAGGSGSIVDMQGI